MRGAAGVWEVFGRVWGGPKHVVSGKVPGLN